jgi:hypothetical protein
MRRNRSVGEVRARVMAGLIVSVVVLAAAMQDLRSPVW